MRKIKVGIIGTGNIGTDLLIKINRSRFLECGIFTGRNPDSAGIEFAKKLMVPVSFDSIHAIIENPSCCDIVFDATSAKVHEYNAPILKALNKFTIDLTPSKIGKMCVPVLNLDECLNEVNVNLITCGGQASIPIAYAISKVQPQTQYIEVVASIASRSAGAGTRNNIDEFTQTTKEALCVFTGIQKTKAIIILNPAEPPITMRNTVYASVEKPDMNLIYSSVHDIAESLKKYIPGYRIILGPVYENNRVTTTIEVVGLGDYLPAYSGNLDIITCAALNIAEEYAKRKLLSI